MKRRHPFKMPSNAIVTLWTVLHSQSALHVVQVTIDTVVLVYMTCETVTLHSFLSFRIQA